MANEKFNYSVSVDCVIFGFDDTGLKVLLIKRGEKPFLNHWALPGDLIQSKESIDEAVYRILKDLTGLKNVFMEQVKTFGDVGRHPLGRVFTVSYFSLIKIRDYMLSPSSFAIEAKWHSVKRLVNLLLTTIKFLPLAKKSWLNL